MMDIFINEIKNDSINIGHQDYYDDFHFLKPILEKKKFVFLGESNPCVKEYDVAKVNLIKYLHQQLGFNVLAFEGDFGDCIIGDFLSTDLDSMKFMFGSIGRIRSNEYILELFDYIKETKQQQPLQLTGIDLNQNEDGHLSSFLRSQLPDNLKLILLEFEKRANEIIFDTRMMKRLRLRKEVEEIESIGNEFIKALEKNSFPTMTLRKITIRTVKNRLKLVKGAVKKSILKLFNYWDELKAENLKYLSQVYPNEKFMIWANNLDIMKKGSASCFPSYKSTFENLPHFIKETSYVLGLYAKEGQMIDDDEHHYPIKKASKKHLEWLLNHTPHQNCFIQCGLKWGQTKWKAFEGGNLRISFKPAEQYDGILYFKKVSPAYFSMKK
ncbi:erythromycin esterase family protein [Bacillus aquiflavi]|nr:erythromycin esterase family protein [Bacillus aquiflavi]